MCHGILQGVRDRVKKLLIINAEGLLDYFEPERYKKGSRKTC